MKYAVLKFMIIVGIIGIIGGIVGYNKIDSDQASYKATVWSYSYRSYEDYFYQMHENKKVAFLILSIGSGIIASGSLVAHISGKSEDSKKSHTNNLSVQDRLKELDNLYAIKKITEQEYQTKRNQIISGL